LLDLLDIVGLIFKDGVNRIGYAEYFAGIDTCKYHDHGPDKLCYKSKPAFRF
jgi:hypothetical protein